MTFKNTKFTCYCAYGGQLRTNNGEIEVVLSIQNMTPKEVDIWGMKNAERALIYGTAQDIHTKMLISMENIIEVLIAMMKDI